MIFQFFNLLDDLTVLDNVLLPAQLAGMRRAKARARRGGAAGRAADRAPRDAYPGRLSGGERQRVAIARALVNRPALLLADEPTGALDTATGEEIGELLLDLNGSGQTLVMVTHNPDFAARYASRVVTLVDGRITGDRHPGRGPAAAPQARPMRPEGGCRAPCAAGVTRRRVQTFVISLVLLVPPAPWCSASP